LHERDHITKRFDALTTRERDVFALLIAGHANKVMASELGLSERTVEVYRARIMKKNRRALARAARAHGDGDAVHVSLVAADQFDASQPKMIVLAVR